MFYGRWSLCFIVGGAFRVGGAMVYGRWSLCLW